MSDRRTTTITIDHNNSSHSESLTDDDDRDSQEFSSSQADEREWADEFDDIDPNDSASASAEYQPPPRRPTSHPSRNPSRRHRLPHHHHPRQPFAYQAPNPPPMQTVSSEASDEYIQGYGRGPYAPPPPPAHSGYYGARGPAPGYPQSVVGGYPPNPYHPGGQVVPYNPFSPMNHSSGASYFGQDPRGSYDVMPYQGGYYGAAGPGPGPGYGGLPPHLQQFMYNSPPPPPPTEAPAPAPPTPAPPPEKKPDPELEAMKAQLELFKQERAKKEEAEKQALIEEKIRKDAEDAFERRMDAMRKAQEEAKKEIEKARIEAEKAARERIEAEKKAEEERAKLHAEAMARAERDARDKLEAERRAEEERKKREAEAAALAEAAAKARIEAAIKAEEDAKKAAEKKAAEEAEWRKKLEEEAKLKAELEARQKIEAERKAAEEAAAAEEAKAKAEEALKNKLMEEAKAKAEEAVKKQEKAPIKFKDAVGRKFSFPFHLCQTWTGMEELIKQAFLHVEVIGPHVQEGHYDLIGPNGEIILPSVWEKVVEPDWAITMHMWPMDKNPLRHHPMQGQPMDPRLVDHMRRHAHDPRMQGRGVPMGQMPNMRPMGRPPPGGGGHGGGGAPPPPGWMGRGQVPQHARPMPQGVNIVDAKPPKDGRKSDKKQRDSIMSFLSGKPAKSSSKKRK